MVRLIILEVEALKDLLMATLMEVLSLTNKLLIVQMKTSKLFLAVAVVNVLVRR